MTMINIFTIKQILSAKGSHEKGKPLERVGRKATGLSPESVGIWLHGCRGDQYLPGAASHTASGGGTRCTGLFYQKD